MLFRQGEALEKVDCDSIVGGGGADDIWSVGAVAELSLLGLDW